MLIKTQATPIDVHEFENAEQFDAAMDEASAIDGERKMVEIVIQVSGDTGGWHDAKVVYRGPYRRDLTMPTQTEIVGVGLSKRARRAKAVMRSTVRTHPAH